MEKQFIKYIFKSKILHTCDTEVYDSFSHTFVTVLEMALVVTTLWDIQIVHVHCCLVMRIQAGVLPCLDFDCFFFCMVAIHKLDTPLKVEKSNCLLSGKGTVNGHISTNLPSELNVSSRFWKRKVSRSKGVRACWETWKRNRNRMSEVKNEYAPLTWKKKEEI